MTKSSFIESSLAPGVPSAVRQHDSASHGRAERVEFDAWESLNRWARSMLMTPDLDDLVSVAESQKSNDRSRGEPSSGASQKTAVPEIGEARGDSDDEWTVVADEVEDSKFCAPCVDCSNMRRMAVFDIPERSDLRAIWSSSRETEDHGED